MTALRVTLARWLQRLATWIDVPRSVVTLVVPKDALYYRAVVLVADQEAMRSGSGMGESKRHQVLARLIKEFPTRSKRDVARAIEAAL